MCRSLSWKAFRLESMTDLVSVKDFVRLNTYISCWRNRIDILTNFENITGSIELHCVSSFISWSATEIQLVSTVDRRFKRDCISLTEIFNWALVVVKPDWITCSTENLKKNQFDSSWIIQLAYRVFMPTTSTNFKRCRLTYHDC